MALKQKILAGAMAVGLGALVACGPSKPAEEPKPYTSAYVHMSENDRLVFVVEKNRKPLEEYFRLDTNLKNISKIYFRDIEFDGALDRVKVEAGLDEYAVDRSNPEFPKWEKLYLHLRATEKPYVNWAVNQGYVGAWSEYGRGKYDKPNKWGVRFSVPHPREGMVNLYDEGSDGTLDAVCTSPMKRLPPLTPEACKEYGNEPVTDSKELAKMKELYLWARQYAKNLELALFMF